MTNGDSKFFGLCSDLQISISCYIHYQIRTNHLSLSHTLTWAGLGQHSILAYLQNTSLSLSQNLTYLQLKINLQIQIDALSIKQKSIIYCIQPKHCSHQPFAQINLNLKPCFASFHYIIPFISFYLVRSSQFQKEKKCDCSLAQ